MSNAKDNKKATGGAKTTKNATTTQATESKEQTSQVPTNTGETKDQQNSDKQTTGGEVASLGTQGKSAETGEQGADTDNQVKKPKAITEKRERIAKDLFAKRSGLSVIYFTSDLVPFGTENDAKQHAATLDNKIVTPINREG